MTLTEKFAKLTPEQREKFNTITDGAGLDAFLSETGLQLTADEMAAVTDYIVSGQLPLEDEELSNVAGGGCVKVPRCGDCGKELLRGYMSCNCKKPI